MDNNQEFQTYLLKRNRLKDRYETKTIPLSLKQRLAEAEAEKELDDIQSGAFLSDEEEDDDANDLVLQEALNIISDMIDLKQIGTTEKLNTPNLSAIEE